MCCSVQDSRGEGISQDNWDQLLDAENPHKLMYSLQIVESLSRPPKFRRNSYDVSTLPRDVNISCCFCQTMSQCLCLGLYVSHGPNLHDFHKISLKFF